MVAGRGPLVQGNALNGSPQAFLIQSREDLSSQPACGSQTEVADRDAIFLKIEMTDKLVVRSEGK